MTSKDPQTVRDSSAQNGGRSQSMESPGAAEVHRVLLDICRPLPSESLPLAQARGRWLREAVTAPEDQPAFDRSAMDGFAVRRSDRSEFFRVVDEIRAGDWKPRQLQSGEAVRIATGGAVPDEGLEVIPVEDAVVDGAGVRFHRRETRGSGNIRFRGEDCRKGQVLVPEGTRLEHGTLSLLASLGCGRLMVNRLPRVFHLVTGNELVDPDQALGPGQIFDSNSTLVRAFLREWGIEPVQVRVPEDASRARDALMAHGRDADLLLISGGASVGKHDFTRPLLEELGLPIQVQRTRLRPGKPLVVAGVGKPIALGLPGNPLAHFVCLNVFVRTLLLAFAHRVRPSGLERLPFVSGVLNEGLHADANSRETFWPGRWSFQDSKVVLTPLRWTSSGDLTALATANALLYVEGGISRIDAGTPVSFLPTQLFS